MTAPPGKTLADLVPDDGLGPAALDLLRPAARALDTLHDDGRVHRGLTPHAIRLDADGQVSLSDPVDGEPPSAPAPTGTVGGAATPVYRAPEQTGRTLASHRSDVYSFACVAFHAITGTPPFTTASLLEQVSGDVPSAHRLRADVPPAVDDVFTTALAATPEARPASASVVVDGLVSAFGGRYRPPAGPAMRRAVLVTAIAAVVAITFLVTALVVASGP